MAESPKPKGGAETIKSAAKQIKANSESREKGRRVNKTCLQMENQTEKKTNDKANAARREELKC